LSQGAALNDQSQAMTNALERYFEVEKTLSASNPVKFALPSLTALLGLKIRMDLSVRPKNDQSFYNSYLRVRLSPPRQSDGRRFPGGKRALRGIF